MIQTKKEIKDKQIKDYVIFYHEHATHVHGPNGTIGQIILCGGDSLLLNLPDILSEKLNLPVKLGNPLVNLSFNKKEMTLLFLKESPLFIRPL